MKFTSINAEGATWRADKVTSFRHAYGVSRIVRYFQALPLLGRDRESSRAYLLSVSFFVLTA